MTALTKRHFLVGTGALFASAVSSPAWATVPDALLFTGGRIVDPDSDGPAIQADVLVGGGVIRRVAPRIRDRRRVRSIDVGGRFLCPGLWDMHAHLAALNPVGSKPESYVAAGVLAVRDMGGRIDELKALKGETRAGRVAPALVMAGPTLNGLPVADFHRVVKTEAEARIAVRELKAQGVDFLKVHRSISREAFLAVVDEGRRLQLRVCGHVPLAMTWKEAATSGMHTIEHIQTIVENEVKDPRSVAEITEAVLRLEGPYGEEMWRTLAQRDVYLDPTLYFYETSIGQANPSLAAQRRQLYTHLKQMVGQAHRDGVRLLAGTDAAVGAPGSFVIDELERLVECGLTARAALRTATSVAARAAERPALGRVTPGAPASFLVLGRDPTADIRALRDLEAVVLRGRHLDQNALAAMTA